jgi:hypothetical protein
VLLVLPRLVKKACERPPSAQEARPAGHVFSQKRSEPM